MIKDNKIEEIVGKLPSEWNIEIRKNSILCCACYSNQQQQIQVVQCLLLYEDPHNIYYSHPFLPPPLLLHELYLHWLQPSLQRARERERERGREKYIYIYIYFSTNDLDSPHSPIHVFLQWNFAFVFMLGTRNGARIQRSSCLPCILHFQIRGWKQKCCKIWTSPLNCCGQTCFDRSQFQLLPLFSKFWFSTRKINGEYWLIGVI